MAEARQRGPSWLAPGYNDGGQRSTSCSLEGLFPATVDFDEVEQRADDAVDPGEQFGSRSTSSLIERPLEGVGTGLRTGLLLLGLAQCLFSQFEAPSGGHMGSLGLRPRCLQAESALLGLGQPLAQFVILALEESGPTLHGSLASDELIQGPAVALQGVLERVELSPGNRDGLFGLAQLRPVAPRGQMLLELGHHCRLGRE